MADAPGPGVAALFGPFTRIPLYDPGSPAILHRRLRARVDYWVTVVCAVAVLEEVVPDG